MGITNEGGINTKRIHKLLLCMVIILSFALVVPIQSEAAAKINKKTVTLIKGQTTTLKVTGTKSKITWSSNKTSVASVSSKGKVTAKKKGTATITAKVGKKKYTCKVTVETPSLNNTALTLNVGGTSTLKMSGTSQVVKWSSSKKSVATVSNGKITAKAAGSATITAKVGGKTYKCKVTVEKEEDPYPKRVLSSSGLNKKISIKDYFVSSDRDMYVVEIKNNSNETISITGNFALYHDDDWNMGGSFDDICIEKGKTGILVEYCKCNQAEYTIYVEKARNYGQSISDIKYTAENTGHSVYIVIPELPYFIIEDQMEYDVRGYVLFKQNGKLKDCREIAFYEWDENLRSDDEAFYYGSGSYNSFEVAIYKYFR